VSGIIAIFLVVFSTIMIVVDGTAIIITYISIPFSLFAISLTNRNIVKTYSVLFLISHLVLSWRISSDATDINMDLQEKQKTIINRYPAKGVIITV